MTLTLPWEFSGLCSKDYWASLCPALAPVFFPPQEEVAYPRRQKLPGDKKPPHPFHPPCEEPFFLDDVISGSRASEQLWVTRCWQLLAGEMP